MKKTLNVYNVYLFLVIFTYILDYSELGHVILLVGRLNLDLQKLPEYVPSLTIYLKLKKINLLALIHYSKYTLLTYSKLPSNIFLKVSDNLIDRFFGSNKCPSDPAKKRHMVHVSSEIRGAQFTDFM